MARSGRSSSCPRSDCVPSPMPLRRSVESSCVSISSCFAVGEWQGGPSALAEEWNGTSWVRVVATPVGPTEGLVIPGLDELSSVSCTATTSCVAVGSDFSEHWAGTSFALMPGLPYTRPIFGSLAAVSCASAASCMAVGEAFYPTPEPGFDSAESWNGSRWTNTLFGLPIASHPSDTYGFLLGVDCLSAQDCVAVGGFDLPIISTWNGTTWTLQPSPA
jgi:hypothetical protein